MDDLNLDIDPSDANKALDAFTSNVKELQRAIESLANLPSEKIKAELGKVSTAVGALGKAVETDLKAVRSKIVESGKDAGKAYGQGMVEGLQQDTGKVQSLVRAEVQKVQSAYESELRKGIKVSAPVLLDFKERGASLMPDDRVRLNAYVASFREAGQAYASQVKILKAQADEGAKALRGVVTGITELQSLKAKSASKMTEADLRLMWGLPTRDEMKSFAASLKAQMQGDMQTQEWRGKSAGKMTETDLRLMWGLPTRDEMKSFAASLKAQMQGDMRTQEWRGKSAGKMTETDLRLMWGLPTRDEMKSFAASLKAQMQADVSTEKLRAKSAGKFTEADIRNLFNLPDEAEMQNFTAGLKARLRSEAKALQEAARSMVRQATDNATGPYSTLSNRKSVTGLEKKSSTPIASAGLSGSGDFDSAGRGARALTKDLNDVHSAARGVASGFNAMWLTWGNLAPLLVGAALSNAFVQSVKKGSEFAQTMTAIEALAGEAGSKVAELSNKAIELGSKGPYGPLEMAQAFKTLALAGLDANKQMQAISVVKNFAIVGETTLDESAKGLVAIATAYGYQAKNFSVVADVVAKTASSSMASVQDMTEAFRQASVVAQQYGVSLEDTSTILALLSQIGIAGSAAGTSMRNMYTELMGSSKKARQVLKDTLKIDVWDNAAQAMKPLPVILEDMARSLDAYDSKSRNAILSTLGNERGTKALSASLTALYTEYDKVGDKGVKVFEKLRKDLEDAPGYAAEAAAIMGTTTANSIKSVGSALESSLVLAFKRTEPAIESLTVKLRSVFASEEFRSGVSALAGQLATATQFLLDHATAIEVVVKAYVAYKTVSIGADLLSIGLSKVATISSAVSTAVSSLSLAATGAASAMRGGTAATAAMATALGAVGPAAEGAAVGLGAMAAAALPLAVALAAVGAVLGAVYLSSQGGVLKMEEGYGELENSQRSMMDSINEEIAKLDAQREARESGLQGAAAAAAIEKNLAKGRIEQIYAQKVALIDLEEQEQRNQAAATKRWLGWAPGVSDDIDSGLQNTLKLIEERRTDAAIERQLAISRVDDLHSKAKAEAVAAAKEIKDSLKNRPRGENTFDPDALSGGNAVSQELKDLERDNVIKQLEKQFSLALQATENYVSTRKTILDNAKSAEAVSAGMAMGKELMLTREAERAELDLINEYTQKIEQAYANKRAGLEALDKKRAPGSPEKARIKTDLENLKNEHDTFTTQLQGRRDKLDNSIYTRVQKQASEAAGAIRKLKLEREEYERTERQRFVDAVSESDFNRSTVGMSSEKAGVARAEFDERRTLMSEQLKQEEALRKARQDQKDLLSGMLDSAEYYLSELSSDEFLANMPADIKAVIEAGQSALDLRVSQLEALKESMPGKVERIGGLAAGDKLAEMGNIDLSTAFDDAKISIDGMTLSIGGAVSAMTQLADAQELYQKARQTEKDPKKLAKLETDSLKAQVKGTGDLLGATKTFFKEKTAGYKAISAAEKVYRAAELALGAANFAIKMGWIGAETAAKVTSTEVSMFLDEAVTAEEVANSATRANAKGIEALVQQLALPFPANIPAFAMVAAALAGLGIMVGGAFGGGGGSSLEAANEGTGTVLGDATAKSESITKSLDYLDDLVSLTSVQNAYTASMASSLQALVSGIGGTSSLIVRNGSIGLAGSGVTTGFAQNGFGSTLTQVGAVVDSVTDIILGPLGMGGLFQGVTNLVGNLFGSSTKITGQGLYMGPTSYKSAASGLSKVSSYADVQEKSKAFGITTSKDNYTKFTDAGPETTRQFALIIKSLGDAVTSAAGVLMGSEAAAKVKLDSYNVNLGKIDLKGLTGTQVEEKLTNIFSAEGDKMAAALIPEIKNLQKVGEGALETLVRYANTLASVNDAMATLGYTMLSASLDGAKLATSLVNAFGGTDAYNSAISSYYQTYYSDSERATAMTNKVSDALRKLGVSAIPTTLTGYRKMVDEFVAGGGLLTEAGQAKYAEMIALADPFSQAMDLMGTSAGDLKDQLIESADSIMEYVKKLTGDRAGLATPMQQLQAARSAYLEDLGLARTGDVDALGRVTDKADAYIAAQKAVTASSDTTQAVISQIIAELTALSTNTKANLPAFASGGYHTGGWALVGEQGPELAYFGSSARIYNAQDSADMLSNGDLVQEVRALRQEVSMLRTQQHEETQFLASSNAAVNQQVANTIVDGMADAAQRQAWVNNSKPEIK